MGSKPYSNQEALEGTATTTPTVLDLARPSRNVEILNDSARDLQFKFGDSENWATLKADEAISMEIWIRKIYLQTTSSVAEYRIRVLG
ncbi:MAG: hypothetical protein ACYTFX_06280 [Planctomycetota bacterium]|jgi:branched-subunit amino acid aminotransferase/4-amino-4-deoxychorismate lyase